MKKIITIIGLGCFVALCFNGCKSTPQQVVYQTMATTSISVPAALALYNDLAKNGKVTVAQNNQARVAYEKYQTAFAVAADAGAAYAATGTTNSQALFEQATLNSAASIADLLNLLQSFGVITTK